MHAQNSARHPAAVYPIMREFPMKFNFGRAKYFCRDGHDDRQQARQAIVWRCCKRWGFSSPCALTVFLCGAQATCISPPSGRGQALPRGRRSPGRRVPWYAGIIPRPGRLVHRVKDGRLLHDGNASFADLHHTATGRRARRRTWAARDSVQEVPCDRLALTLLVLCDALAACVSAPSGRSRALLQGRLPLASCAQVCRQSHG